MSARLSFVSFDPTTSKAGVEALARLPESPAGADTRPVAVALRGPETKLELSVLLQGDAWLLVGPKVRLNRIDATPFTLLRHGDVLSQGDVQVMVVDEAVRWPRLPELEAEVLRRRGATEALLVLDDQLLERGAPSRRLGELQSLLGRGLELEWLAGFPARVRFDVDAPMYRRCPERWVGLLTEDPALQFVRTLEFTEGGRGPAPEEPPRGHLPPTFVSPWLPLLQCLVLPSWVEDDVVGDFRDLVPRVGVCAPPPEQMDVDDEPVSVDEESWLYGYGERPRFFEEPGPSSHGFDE